MFPTYCCYGKSKIRAGDSRWDAKVSLIPRIDATRDGRDRSRIHQQIVQACVKHLAQYANNRLVQAGRQAY